MEIKNQNYITIILTNEEAEELELLLNDSSMCKWGKNDGNLFCKLYYMLRGDKY